MFIKQHLMKADIDTSFPALLYSERDVYILNCLVSGFRVADDSYVLFRDGCACANTH